MKVSGWCVNYIICNLDFRYTEAVVRRCSSEQMLLKISQCWSFFLIKLQAFRPTILLKRDSNMGACCDICKIFKSILLSGCSGNILWTLSLLHMRMMNGIIAWYVLALQCLFYFIVCVSFLSISFFFYYFFVDFTTCLGIEISLSILKMKQCSYS